MSELEKLGKRATFKLQGKEGERITLPLTVELQWQKNRDVFAKEKSTTLKWKNPKSPAV